MRELSFVESNNVAGGDYLDKSTNYDIFWKTFAAASGAGSGYICSIPVALLMCVYGVAYYGIYTPAYYVTAGVYYAGSTAVCATYNAGAYVVNTVTA